MIFGRLLNHLLAWASCVVGLHTNCDDLVSIDFCRLQRPVNVSFIASSSSSSFHSGLVSQCFVSCWKKSFLWASYQPWSRVLVLCTLCICLQHLLASGFSSKNFTIYKREREMKKKNMTQGRCCMILESMRLEK